MKIKGVEVTPSQADVYNVIRDFGPLPDQALVPLAQHALSIHQSSSGIRTRRAELGDKLLVTPAGSIKTGSGRKATTWTVV